MRKVKHPEHVNHERWLISYADFITLLFAFFVVMFAVSQVDTAKAGRFSASFSEAVGDPLGMPHHDMGVFPGAEKASMDEGKAEPAAAAKLEAVRATMMKHTQKDDLPGLIVIRRRNEIVLRLPEGVVFASGDDALKKPAVHALGVIADEIRALQMDVRVEGHTDDVPIRTGRFRSNWDLSTARATAVVLELAGPGKLPPGRLSAAGYGEFHPIAANETVEGRAQNRRVDLVITESAPPEK
jgi:chemotaxis protein MotB